jgi:hypothetical protein
MMLKNYALKGIKQSGSPDILAVKQYHPEVIFSFALLMKRMGMECGWVLIPEAIPDLIVSGYRDHSVDPAVKNSPHAFAIALDVMVSHLDARVPQNRESILEEQIKWITAATETGLFNRGGLYPQQNTIHLDLCDEEWMRTYNGTPFWVKWNAKYEGFSALPSAIEYAKQLIQGSHQ